MSFTIRLTLLLILLVNAAGRSQTILSAGPMLHVNFGGEKIRASWGFEVAWWNFSGFPYSIDVCPEFEKKKFRLYAEIQTGIGVAGISAGPVLEFQTEEKKIRAGVQTSIWANYYWGFDFRMRFIDHKTLICPGTYLKVPFNGRDENGERFESSGNNRDWDD